VFDVERTGSPDQEPGDGEVAEGLLEVETLQQVEERACEQECDRQLQGAAATAIQVVGADQEQRSDRYGKRVKDAQLTHRFDVREHMAAPAHVGCHRRDEIGRGDRCGGERDQRRKRVGAAERAQGMRVPVKTEPPGGRIALVAGQVTPVLRDQPQRDEHDQQSGEAVVNDAEERAEAEGSEQEDA
jgi:hypothetical protein